MRVASIFIVLAALSAGCATPRDPRAVDRQTAQAHRLLARGVTMDSLFDRPDDARWVEWIRSDIYREMRRVGFTAVRIPFDFSTALRADDGERLQPLWLERVERVVRQADRAGLAVIVAARMPLDLTTPASQSRLLADWNQLARHLCATRECVVFELLDAPNSGLTDAEWSRFAEEIRLAIRESNPDRVLIVGPAQRSDPHRLARLDLPPDPRLLFAFALDQPVASARRGDPDDHTRVASDLDRVAKWARENNRKLLCADFGAPAEADPSARVQWTSFVARALEARNIVWCYKDLAGETGVYDPAWRVWRQPLLGALLER